MTKKFLPRNELEQYLVEFQKKNVNFSEFIRKFIDSQLILPSAIKVKLDENILPLFFDKNGQKMVSVFTSAELLTLYEKTVKCYLIIRGRDLLEQLPANYGLVINPGYRIGFDISADGIKKILLDF